jgi:aminopeptidase YwaD
MRLSAPPELRERLVRHLQKLVRERDPDCAPAGHAAVRDYVARQLGAHGVVTVHEFEYFGRTHHNLILDLPGQQDGKLVLIGAHYDAVPGSPGADDNASALAVLIEFARAFEAAPARRPIRLIAFDLEEHERAGSRAYAADLRQRGEPLWLMVSLEMLGYRDGGAGAQRYPAGLRYIYPATGDFIGLIGNLRTLPLMARVAGTVRDHVPCEFLTVPFCGRILPDTRRSDHASFWDLGYPAIMVTDTANMRNPHYHQPSDCIETLDLDFLTSVCRGLTAGLATL